MKRITVSLPDALVDHVKLAAGGDGQVSAYVAAALTAYVERESLAEILADWEREIPASNADRRRVDAELERVGLRPAGRRDHGSTS